MRWRNIETPRDIREVLNRIDFARSCIDMGWEFELLQIYARSGSSLNVEPFGTLMRASFQRPDRDTHRIARGFGRYWHLPKGITESGIVKSAYAAVRLNVEHELMEALHFDGVRIFDPHHDVDDLKSAALHHLNADTENR